MKQDFIDFLEALAEFQCEYLIVGAHAMSVFGYTRATGDIDVFVGNEKENSEKVWNALKLFGAPLSAHEVNAQFFEIKGNLYQVGIPPSRIDILTQISGVEFKDAMETAEFFHLGGIQVKVLSLENLILNKQSTGREKDLLDVKELEKLRNK